MQALNQALRGPVLDIACISFETLDKLLKLPQTEFPHLSKGKINSNYSMEFGELNEIIHVKQLEWYLLKVNNE